MKSLDLVKLNPLMELTSGIPEIRVGLIDGPVATNLPDISSENVLGIQENNSGICSQKESTACQHGTFVAGILFAKRTSPAPAICPGCTLLLRPIFLENISGNRQMPSASALELAEAISDCVAAGTHVINMSVYLSQSSPKGIQELEKALNQTVKSGVIVVAAAGNQGTIGSTPITRHNWVVPVAACDLQGRLLSYSNFGSSIGRGGLRAPGDEVTSLGVDGKTLVLGGTSAAAPFVTGTVALLWSEFPNATAADIKLAITKARATRRKAIIPNLLDAWNAYQIMKTTLRK